jgi:hypothetical protein
MNTDEKDWIYLTTVRDDVEYGITAGLLQTADIPSVKKLKGIDNLLNVVIGMPIAGIDIMIPKDRYEEAVGLLNADIEEYEESAEESNEESDEEKDKE